MEALVMESRSRGLRFADLIAEELVVRGVLTRIEDIVPEVQARVRDATPIPRPRF